MRRSMATPVNYGYSSEDYQYPFEWELKTDKSAYVQDEPVAVTFNGHQHQRLDRASGLRAAESGYPQPSGTPRRGCAALR